MTLLPVPDNNQKEHIEFPCFTYCFFICCGALWCLGFVSWVAFSEQAPRPGEVERTRVELFGDSLIQLIVGIVFDYVLEGRKK